MHRQFWPKKKQDPTEEQRLIQDIIKQAPATITLETDAQTLAVDTAKNNEAYTKMMANIKALNKLRSTPTETKPHWKNALASLSDDELYKLTYCFLRHNKRTSSDFLLRGNALPACKLLYAAYAKRCIKNKTFNLDQGRIPPEFEILHKLMYPPHLANKGVFDAEKALAKEVFFAIGSEDESSGKLPTMNELLAIKSKVDVEPPSLFVNAIREQLKTEKLGVEQKKEAIKVDTEKKTDKEQKIIAEVKEEEEESYAELSEIGKTHLLDAVKQYLPGKLGRIFDTPKSISSKLSGWANDFFEANKLTPDENKKIKNGLFTKSNIDVLSRQAFIQPVVTSAAIKECPLIKKKDSDPSPLEDPNLFVDILSDAAYVRHQDKLFYICKTKNEITPILFTKKACKTFDSTFAAEFADPKTNLSSTDLQKIQGITGHQHQPEYHHTDPPFAPDGQLAPWVKKIIPPGFDTLVSNLIKNIYQKTTEITFDADGELQPWLIAAINKVKAEPPTTVAYLNNKYQKNIVDSFITQAVSTALREALLGTIPFKKDSEEYEAIFKFLSCGDFIFQHQYKYLDNLLDEMKNESRNHFRNPDDPLAIAELILTLKKMQENLIKDPLMSTHDFVDASKKNLAVLAKKRKAQVEEKLIMMETVAIEPFSSHDEFKESHAFFKTTASPLEQPETVPCQRDLTFKQQDGGVITATIKEQLSAASHGPISAVSKVDDSLNTAMVLAKAACAFVDYSAKIKANLFPGGQDEAQQFFKDAISAIRSNHRSINAETLLESLKNHFGQDEAQLSRLSAALLQGYRYATEQAEPYNKDEHLPNDAFIRLARHQVESYRQFCGEKNPTIVIGPDCWDPHYVEAIMLYCHKMGYPAPEHEGWKITSSTEKQDAFNSLYEEKFAALDKLTPYEPTELKGAPDDRVKDGSTPESRSTIISNPRESGLELGFKEQLIILTENFEQVQQAAQALKKDSPEYKIATEAISAIKSYQDTGDLAAFHKKITELHGQEKQIPKKTGSRFFKSFPKQQHKQNNLEKLQRMIEKEQARTLSVDSSCGKNTRL